MADKVIHFFHGAEENIDNKISDGTVNESDFIVTTNDKLIYIDENKTKHTLGGDVETESEHQVNLGTGGAIGGLETGDTIPQGTSLDELIILLTQRSEPPTYNQPAVTCRVSSGQSATSYEVGTNITTTLQGVFTKNDAGALTTLAVYKSGTEEPLISGSTSPQTTDEQTFQIPDGTVTFYAKATYGEGEIKDDNLGNPSPEGHITAGTKQSGNVTFTGKRNLFYGTGVGSVPEVTSETVRGLTNKQLGPSNGTTFNINIAVGQQYVIFAYPATLRDVNQVMYVETNDTGMAASFTKTTISVQGANGATGADYKVYTYGMATPAAAGMTFKVTI